MHALLHLQAASHELHSGIVCRSLYTITTQKKPTLRITRSSNLQPLHSFAPPVPLSGRRGASSFVSQLRRSPSFHSRPHHLPGWWPPPLLSVWPSWLHVGVVATAAVGSLGMPPLPLLWASACSSIASLARSSWSCMSRLARSSCSSIVAGLHRPSVV